MTKENELARIPFNPNHYFENFNTSQEWFQQDIPKFIQSYLWSLSDLFAPQEMLSRMNPSWIEYYQKALAETHSENILIIGTGFGILPLLALSENRTIYACERYPFTARLAQGIIHKYSIINKVDINPIKFMCKNPMEINCPKDIPAKCDLLIYDDFDYTLLETGFLAIVEHLKQELLTPDARIIPCQTAIHAMAVELVIDNDYFNLEELNQYLWNIGPKPFDANKQKYNQLSEPREILTFNFEKDPLGPRQKEIAFQIVKSGQWNAIVYWHELCGTKHYCIQYIEPVNVQQDTIEQITVDQQLTKLRLQSGYPIKLTKDRLLPSWHFDMVNDTVRNQNYHRSITKIVQDHNIKTVLDIGTGTGLLSMMAAKANPEVKVYSCEIFKNIYETAVNIIKQNGLDSQITVINKDCLKLELPEQVDLIICEVFDCGLIGEGALHFLDYAKKNLLKKDGKILPQSGSVKAMLIEYRTPDLKNINLSLTNAYRWTPDYGSIDLSTIPYSQLSDAFEVFQFDFASSEAKPAQKELDIPVIKDGIVSACVFWFDLNLDEDTTITTSPFSSESLHWKQAIQYVQEVSVQEGARIPLIAKHNGSRIEFQINREKLAPEINLIPTPRFDPNWLKKYYDLDAVFQQMIFKIATNPEEYKTLVEVSAKLASQPGNFDIRAKFANRLAESFYVR